MNDESRMLASFSHDPFVLMRAIADRCREEGKEEEAVGWLWLADNERFPQSREDYTWGWTYGSGRRRHQMPDAMQETADAYLRTFYLKKINGMRDLGALLRETAKVVGKILTDKELTFPKTVIEKEDKLGAPPKPPKAKKVHRKYADMTPEEVAARRELRIANREYNRLNRAEDNWYQQGEVGNNPVTNEELDTATMRARIAREALYRLIPEEDPEAEEDWNAY